MFIVLNMYCMIANKMFFISEKKIKKLISIFI